MDGVFGGNRGALQLFNSDISNWDVSQVTDMQAMFQKTWAFNQDLSQWDVSRVGKSNVFVFNYCSCLSLSLLVVTKNSPLQFTISATMRTMFGWSKSFDQDLSAWVSTVFVCSNKPLVVAPRYLTHTWHFSSSQLPTHFVPLVVYFLNTSGCL